MTKAQAVNVVGDLVNAGYNAQALQYPDGTWVMQASSKDGQVQVSAIQSFAAARGVVGRTNEAEFI